MTTFYRESKDEATRVAQIHKEGLNWERMTITAHYMNGILDVGRKNSAVTKKNSAVTKKNSAVTVRIRDGGRKAVVRRRR